MASLKWKPSMGTSMVRVCAIVRLTRFGLIGFNSVQDRGGGSCLKASLAPKH